MDALAALKALFPEGCVVVLKSGSPALTVEWTREDGAIPVVWFNGLDLCRDCFSPEALVKMPG